MTRRESKTPDLARHLIGGKLDLPKPPADLVARPHLIEMLDRGRDARVSLVSAPAGYGKTMLVARWLDRDTAPPVAWLTLDALDNDLVHFVTYVIAALRRVVDGCLPETEQLLAARNVPSLQVLAESMLCELQAIEQQVVLVLDDYQVISARDIHDFLISLVSNLPSTLHLVIVSRIDPYLPLSQWRSRCWLHELRVSELRFSREETGAFFAAPGEIQPSEEGVDTIHRRTEGWATGLRLAQLSLAGAADPEERLQEFSASERLVADFLVDEVIDGLPPEIREFLAVTCVLERFSPALCDTLLAGSDPGSAGRGRELLERVFKKNLFLIPLGPTGGWYRYHHLFRQLLLDRHDRLGPTTSRVDALRRAAEWFGEEGWYEDCLTCHLAAGDLDEAADVIADRLNEVITADLSQRTLFRWITLFPAGAERGRLPLLIASAYMSSLRTDPDGVDVHLRLIDETCRDAQGERQREWWRMFQQDLDYLHCFTAFWNGDIERACQHGARVFDASPDSRSFAVLATLMYHGGGLALAGRWGEYLRLVEPWTTGPDLAVGQEQMPYLVVKAAVHMYRGELAPSRATAARLMSRTDSPVPKYFEALGALSLGVEAYERDQLDEATRHFLSVESRRFDSAGLAFHGAAMGFARIALARGDLEAAERHGAEARAFAVSSQSSLLMRASEQFDLCLAAAAGKPSEIDLPPPPAHDFMALSIVAPSFDWARVQIQHPAADVRPTALGFVEEALQLAEAHGVTRRVIQLSALRSLALDALDRRDEAIACLEDALRRGVELGFVRSFVDCGAGLRGLLGAVLERNPDDEPLAKLVEAIEVSLRQAQTGSAAPARAASAGAAVLLPDDSTLVEDLTNRELDVLELLERRWSNKEIAAQLGISAATVKMHTLNIYGKLGVHGRRQAVAAAIERGLIAR